MNALTLQRVCTHPLVESICTVSIDGGGDAQINANRHFANYSIYEEEDGSAHRASHEYAECRLEHDRPQWKPHVQQKLEEQIQNKRESTAGFLRTPIYTIINLINCVIYITPADHKVSMARHSICIIVIRNRYWQRNETQGGMKSMSMTGIQPNV